MGVEARNNIQVVGAAGAPVLLLCHGFGCDQNIWRPIVDRLSSRFQIVLMDHVGAGASDPAAWDAGKYSQLSGYASDVVEILRELDLRDVVFVEHEGAFEMAPVALGRSDSASVEITSGLRAGTPYVSDGAFQLKAVVVTSALDSHAGHGH